MIRRLIILLLIVGCGDSGTNEITCMEELQVETCVELDELFEITTNEYLSATEESDIIYKLEILQNIKSCKDSSCPETPL